MLAMETRVTVCLNAVGAKKGFPGPWNHLRLGAFVNARVWSVSAVLIAIPGGLGTIVDQAEKKERRRKQTNAGKTMT